jgi:hypothetical protein
VLHGNWLEALRGGESVFYYGGPGLRYFRAIEKLVFGETYLGYLSLVLLFPFALFMLWRRFLSPRWALCLTLLFVATPAGILFGTSFIQYASLAARGFADPAAYILFVCGLIPLVGASAAGPQTRFLGAIGAGLLLACAIFMKPIVAPAVGVLLAGAGIAALSQGKWSRLAGLCFGFAPVLLMPLHNWYFGGRLVLFSSNANLPSLLVMPPRAWGAALCELLHGQWTAPHLRQAAAQILGWLSGPSHIAALAPLGAVAVVLVAFVALGNRFKGWLRLIALATLTQHAVALFYATTPRYHFLTWLLTLTVLCVWLREAALPWLRLRYPGAWQRAAGRLETMRLARWIAAVQRTTERAPAMPAGA